MTSPVLSNTEELLDHLVEDVQAVAPLASPSRRLWSFLAFLALPQGLVLYTLQHSEAWHMLTAPQWMGVGVCVLAFMYSALAAHRLTIPGEEKAVFRLPILLLLGWGGLNIAFPLAPFSFEAERSVFFSHFTACLSYMTMVGILPYIFLLYSASKGVVMKPGKTAFAVSLAVASLSLACVSAMLHPEEILWHLVAAVFLTVSVGIVTYGILKRLSL